MRPAPIHTAPGALPPARIFRYEALDDCGRSHAKFRTLSAAQRYAWARGLYVEEIEHDKEH